MPAEIPATLGRRIADCREGLGWTQKQLAEHSNLSITFVSELENDRRAPGTEALLALANALGASLDYLVKGIIDPTRARRPLVLLPGLAAAAEEGHWSVGMAADLMRFDEMIIARRSSGGEPDPTGRKDIEYWKDLYKRYTGGTAGGSPGT